MGFLRVECSLAPPHRLLDASLKSLDAQKEVKALEIGFNYDLSSLFDSSILLYPYTSHQPNLYNTREKKKTKTTGMD